MQSETRVPSPYAIGEALRLAHEYLERGDNEPEDGDYADLWDALADTGADVADIVRRLALAATEARASAEAVEGRIEVLRSREKRFARREQSCRDAVLAIINALPELFPARRFADPLVSATVMPGRLGLSLDQAALPDEYWRITRSPDTKQIKEDIAQGVVVPGAEMQRGDPYLQIRSS